MKYYISVEMDGKENIDELVKAMEPIQKLPHVTCVSLVDVEENKETFRKNRINKLVSSLETIVRDLKNELYVNVDKAIHYLYRELEHLRYFALSEDKSFSCFYAEERLYIVRKKIGSLPVYMFIPASSSKDATDKAIEAWKNGGMVYKEEGRNFCETCIHGFPSETGVVLGGHYEKRTRYFCAYSGAIEENSWTCASYQEKEAGK